MLKSLRRGFLKKRGGPWCIEVLRIPLGGAHGLHGGHIERFPISESCRRLPFNGCQDIQAFP